MDEGVDERLMITALNVIRHFLPRVRGLAPHLPCVAEDERLAIFQQGNQAPGILGVIQSIDNAAAFVLSVPPGAEDSRPAYRAFIRQKRACIRQDTCLIHQAERDEVALLEALPGPFFIAFPQLGKGEVCPVPLGLDCFS